MAQGPPAGWPPTAWEPDAVDEAARLRLQHVGIADVASVAVEPGSPPKVTVTLETAGSPATVRAIRDALAPARVEVVWYTGDFAPTDETAAPASDPSQTCGACGAPEATWHRTLPNTTLFGLAVAREWVLCATCHDLADNDAEDALTVRIRIAGLADEGRRDVARLLIGVPPTP
jgi:hypothetical protein